ncbi:hypothetical protein PAMP_010375 [Pampus punctatissimus]
MDPTEDLSARVLLKHILTTETPRTPITRSTSKTLSTSRTRRSTRLSKKDAVGQTPQDLLRRSLKHKMRESISRKSQPPTTRRTNIFRQTPKPAQVSQLFDEEDTPRHILMNILRTEPVKSPVVHKKTVSEEPQLPSANSSITSKCPSTELSGLELPDITIGNAASIAKGLSRKRPRRSLNVTAFEKRLQDGDDVEDNESVDDHSSISGLSSTSLSLKTPFVDVRTEKRGLQRRVSNRRKITVEEFNAAVKKRHMEGMGSVALEEWGLSETSHSEGFTLGLTKLGEPDITADIINCNTALYAQTDVMTSNLSITATQDKPTVMASQLQREMEQEEQLEVESAYVLPTEEGAMAEPQDEDCISHSQLEKATAEAQNEEGKLTADCHLEDAVAMPESEDAAETQTRRDVYEEEENRESQTEVESAADSQTKDDVATLSQSEEEDDAEECQSDQQDPAVNSQFEEENSVAVSQIEDENDGKQKDEHISRRAHRSEGGLIVPVTEAEGGLLDATEAGLSEGKSKAHSASDLHSGLEMGGCEISQPCIGSSTKGQNDVSSTEAEPDSDKENSFHLLELKYQDSDNLGDASSEEAAALDPAEQEEEDKEADEEEIAASDPAEQEEEEMEDEEEAAASVPAEQEEEDKEADEEEMAASDPAEQEEDEDKENEEEAAASDPGEQEEGWEDDNDDDEESKDVPMKTPAFVREKRIFSHSDPQASPTTTKNIQASDGGLPPGKTKQVRRRKTGTAKRETGLPKSYLMGTFKHFAKTKVSADVYPVLKETMDKFFDRLAEDLETYALHAKRKTIEVEDAELLLKRQGYVNDKVPVEVLIEKYLRMDQRKLLIPIATSGNVVIPKSRR